MRANSFSDCLGVYSKYNYTLVTWPIDQNKKMLCMHGGALYH